MIVACDSPDSRLLRGLAELLAPYFTPAVASGAEVLMPERADLLLCRAENGCRISCAGAILVLGENPPARPELSAAGCGRVIFPAQNTACAALAASLGLPGLDCGLSLKDTLTLSSRAESTAVASLQRPVEGLSGRRVEPFDLPISIRRDDPPHLLLCCAGICVLTGVFTPHPPNTL